ncbi:hypothetical protein DF107_14385 [Burkholderia stagnalis]|nr:hypothetical protein DF161_18905 [Burkholderia stagnalis]RQR02245.1 hypothetical protein DF031_08345 [Burkholderia stagnalis]RQX92245.1 hypothetical protein DF120_14305 [Burkholderia stagnalis]RQY81082.1 hypothetical protein DF107_14385 [Burkholderia stagnalis]
MPGSRRCSDERRRSAGAATAGPDFPQPSNEDTTMKQPGFIRTAAAWFGFPAALLALGLFAGVPGAAHAAPFTVLDNTAYADVSIGHGAVKINFIPARYCKPLTVDANGRAVLPSRSAWVNLINTYDPTPADAPGYLVLDCEELYLSGSSATIANHLAILKQLQAWAREVRPNRTLGWYGLVNTAHISSADANAAYRGVAELMDLDGGHTAHFPSAYIRADGTDSWTRVDWATQLNRNIASAAQADALSRTGPHPVFPYLWPQYYDRNTQLVPGSQWQYILNDILATTANGAVIWGGQNPAVAYNPGNGGAGEWVGVTQTFLDSLGNRN